MSALVVWPLLIFDFFGIFLGLKALIRKGHDPTPIPEELVDLDE
jgi:hypothetical protein